MAGDALSKFEFPDDIEESPSDLPERVSRENHIATRECVMLGEIVEDPADVEVQPLSAPDIDGRRSKFQWTLFLDDDPEECIVPPESKKKPLKSSVRGWTSYNLDDDSLNNAYRLEPLILVPDDLDENKATLFLASHGHLMAANELTLELFSIAFPIGRRVWVDLAFQHNHDFVFAPDLFDPECFLEAKVLSLREDQVGNVFLKLDVNGKEREVSALSCLKLNGIQEDPSIRGKITALMNLK